MEPAGYRRRWCGRRRRGIGSWRGRRRGRRCRHRSDRGALDIAHRHQREIAAGLRNDERIHLVVARDPEQERLEHRGARPSHLLETPGRSIAAGGVRPGTPSTPSSSRSRNRIGQARRRSASCRRTGRRRERRRRSKAPQRLRPPFFRRRCRSAPSGCLPGWIWCAPSGAGYRGRSTAACETRSSRRAAAR